MTDPGDRAEWALERAVERGWVSAATIEEVRASLDVSPSAEELLDILMRRGLVDPDALVGLNSSGPVTETLGSGGRPSAEPRDETCDVVGGRYELRGLLGVGGMGQVYRAFDRVLRREVALKVLHVAGPDATRHLLREARAQGRIHHENVCQVFDAAKVERGAYVAMQLISGPSLRQGAASLSFEEKLEVLAQAAEGVHAAHRSGLVHRDLKPANIMLERTATGAWKAYVVDFGLVRDLDSSSRTVEGVAGTPQYMSPEQVRGDLQRIDWRADVYALGATLFELVTGVPVVQAATPVEALFKVVAEEVRFPATPGVSRDLRAVIERCLEKDPARRYGSARELGDELRRLLAGQPVLARPAGRVERARKAIRRNPRLAASVAIGAVVALTLGGMWLATLFRARSQALLAQRFGEETAAIEAMARYAALLPLHDVRGERVLIRERMASMELEMRHAGAVAEGPGSYSIGRGWLALGNPEKARGALERAWRSGYRGPDVACALGLALGELYRRGLEDARVQGGAEMRRRRELALAVELRDPALEYLRAAAGTSTTPAAYVRALIALYEQRLDDALTAARAAAEEVPWLFEARRLEAEAWLARSQEARTHGDLAGAAAALQQAAVPLASAIAMARSDPASLRLESLRCRKVVEVAALQGQFPGSLVPAVAAAAADALVADVDDNAPRIDLAAAYWKAGEWLYDHGSDPTALFTRVRDTAQEALACRPDEALAHEAIGLACWRQGQLEENRGGEALAWYARATDALDAAIAASPHPAGYYGEKGSVLRSVFAVLDERPGQQEAREKLQEALACHDLAVQYAPQLGTVYYNRAVVTWQLAEWDRRHGSDPRPLLGAAIADYRAAAALNPSIRQASNAIGSVYSELGRYLDATGGDPTEAWNECEHHFTMSIEQGKDTLSSSYNLALHLRDRARRALRRDEDPMPLLEQGRAIIARAIEAKSDRSWLWLEAGQLELMVALVHDLRGEPAEQELARADQLLARSLTMNPKDGNVLVAQARLHVLRAARLARGGRSPEAELRAAEAAANAAQESLGGSATAARILGEVALGRARHSDGAARVGSAQDALRRFEEALEVNRLLSVELDPLVAEATRLASRL